MADATNMHPRPEGESTTTAARSRSRRTPAWVRRIRYWFSPESLREFVTTLALVVPLTVLIWVWAEREQTREYKPIVQVSVHALNPSRVMSVVNDAGRPEPANVSVTLVGPKSGIDALGDAINRDPSRARVTLEVPDDADLSATRDLNIQPLLDDQKLFRDFGVTVKSVEPATIRIQTDALVTRDVKVTFRDDAGRVAGIVAEPSVVRVRGPERSITELQKENTLRADVDLTAALSHRTTEPAAPIVLTDVPLRPIDRPNVTLEPAIVRRVTVKLSDAEELELRGVPVYVSQPGGLDAKVTIDPTTTTIPSVRISGPPDLLRQLQAAEGDARPFAQLRIGRSDIGQSGARTPQILNLPQSVTVVDPASVPPVRFEVSRSADGN